MYKEILESIFDEATVYVDNENGYLLQVNPDPNRIGTEYFKLFNSANRSAAKKMARIEFRRPQYVYHDNNEGKEIWTLNSKERKHLMRILNSKQDGKTNWQNAIIQWNLEKRLNRDETKENLLSKKPLKYPEHLPYDLEPPNYLLLRDTR